MRAARGRDISDEAAKVDLLLERCGCPSGAIGDGGNEAEMGNVLDTLGALSIVPSVIRCDELVIAAVSNSGVYDVIAELCRLAGEDLFAAFDHVDVIARLVALGAVDGRTGAADHSEDGVSVGVGLALITELRALVA